MRLRERLVHLSAPLFGAPEANAPGPAPRFLIRYFGTTALLVAIIAVRRPDVLTNPQFFGEDGMLFFPQNILLGFPRALVEPYRGFPYLAQRLIALVGGLVPTLYAPRVYASAAALATSLGLAAFSLPSFRHLVASERLRVAFGVAVLTLPIEVRGEQTLATPTNLGWFVAVWLFLSAVMRLPNRPWRAAGVAMTAAVGALSTPLAAIVAPLWGIRTLRGVARRDMVEALFGFLPLAALAAALLTSPHLGAHATVSVAGTALSMTAEGFLAHTSFDIASLVAPRSVLLALGAAGRATTVAVALLVLAAILATAAHDRRRLATVLLALFGLFAAVGVTLFGRALFSYVPPHSLPSRYQLFPSAMGCLAMVAALDAIPLGRRRVAAIIGVTLISLWARSQLFFIPAPSDLHWAKEGPRLERALRSRCPVKGRYLVHPTYSPLEVIWGEYHPDPSPEARDVIASLARHGTFSQELTSGCTSLAELAIALRVAAGAPPPSLRLALYRAGDPEPLAVVDEPRADLRTGWATFCLPSPGLAVGQLLRVVLQVERGAIVEVMGMVSASAPSNAFADGRAVVGVAGIRQGCVTRTSPLIPFIAQTQGR
jgi:hypothetical protein